MILPGIEVEPLKKFDTTLLSPLLLSLAGRKNISRTAQKILQLTALGFFIWEVRKLSRK